MTTVVELGERALRRLGVVVVPLADRPSIAATVSIATIATAALQELGVVASDETPTAEDQALAEARARAVHAALAAGSMASWADTAIPQAVSEEYVKLTAMQAASSFGKQADPQLIAGLEARVRRVGQLLYAPEMAQNAVMDVHSELVSTGLADWTIQDIPRGAAEPYVMLACIALGPTFGVPFDLKMGVLAHQQLRRMIALPSAGEPVRAEYF